MQSDMKKLTQRCKPLVPRLGGAVACGAGPSGTAVNSSQIAESNSAVVTVVRVGRAMGCWRELVKQGYVCFDRGRPVRGASYGGAAA